MPQLKFYLFGTPRIEIDRQQREISLRKALALLTYLAIMGQSRSRDELATLFWPEAEKRTARTSLRRTIYDIGRRLDPRLIVATSKEIDFDPTMELWIDVTLFRQYAAEGLRKPAQIERLLAAHALYTDDFMAGFNLEDCPAFDEWQFFQREELRQTFAQVLVRLVDQYVDREEHEEALPHARRWLTLDPLHEPAHRRLMELYTLADQQAMALRQYEECIRILNEELGVPPEAETTALFEAIRTRQPRKKHKIVGQKRAKTQPPPHPATPSSSHPLIISRTGSSEFRFRYLLGQGLRLF